MAIMLKNLIGHGYAIDTETELVEKLNADGMLSFSIMENTQTAPIINSIGKMWTVTKVAGSHDDKEYRIIMVDRTNINQKQILTLTARERHIDDLMRIRDYENITGSRTANSYFSQVFSGTGYKFEIKADKVSSNTWENAGDGETKLKMFQEGLERYGLEFEFNYSNNTFTLIPFISRKANYHISTDVNANNLKLEEDSSECFTYIRGYGDFEDDTKFQEGNLFVEYTHELANAFGKRHAPPIIDGRIKHKETMIEKMEKIIEDSIKLSVDIDFISLQEQYPNAVPNLGDLVQIKDDVVKLKEFIRVVEVTTKRSANNKISSQSVVLGVPRRRQRYYSALNNASSFVSGISGGTKALYTMKEKTDSTIKMTRSLIDSTNALEYNGRGIFGKDEMDVVSLEQGKINYSSDGGETSKSAITGSGINPDAIPMAGNGQNGLVTSDDKAKLDTIRSTANGTAINIKGKFYTFTVDSTGNMKATQI